MQGCCGPRNSLHGLDAWDWTNRQQRRGSGKGRGRPQDVFEDAESILVSVNGQGLFFLNIF